MPVKKKKPKSRAAVLAAEINSALKLENPLRVGSDPYFTIERVPTGSLVLDRLIGGGFVRGRHYELFGGENAGKSTILYMTMVKAQERGEICAMVDPEHVFDNERFEFLGGDPGELVMEHPNDAEEAVAVMMMLAKFGSEANLSIVGIDSVSSLVTKEETGKDPREHDQPATQARMMSRALRRITAMNKKTLFLWTNQERINVGVKFGNPNTTSGGRALRYYATGRIEFRRGAKLKRKAKVAHAGKLVETEIVYGRWTQIRVEKEKSTRPQREGAFVFNHDLGIIDPAYEIIQLGLEDGIIARNAGGVYSYTDLEDHEWKGHEKKFTKYLRENEELRGEIETLLIWNTQNQEKLEEPVVEED